MEYQQLKESRGGAAGGRAPTWPWAEIQELVGVQLTWPFSALVVGVGALLYALLYITHMEFPLCMEGLSFH